MAATVRISPVAFMKMQTLVMGFDKEVGWFATCEELAPLDFRIKDVLVFPQYTSGCFVDDERDDPLEFRKWLDTLTDEQYEQRRLWGHSHVNMGTSPSGTDTDMFQRFAETSCAAQINRFAICVILNNRFDMYWWVKDAKTNQTYTSTKHEVNVMIEVEDGLSNLEYFEEMKGRVRDIRPTTYFLFNKGYSSYGSGSFGSNYEVAPGYSYGGYNKYVDNKKEEPAKTTPVTTVNKPKALAEQIAVKDEPAKVNIVDDIPIAYESDWGDDYDDDGGYIGEYYGDGYFGDFQSLAFDVNITSDAVSVVYADNRDISYKNDIVFEDDITGDIYRFNILDETFVEDHPIDTDSVAMELLSYGLDLDCEYFRLYEEDDRHGPRLVAPPVNEEAALEMITRSVKASEYKNGVAIITLMPEEDESNDLNELVAAETEKAKEGPQEVA